MARARLHEWNDKEARHPRDPAEIDKAVTNAYRYARDTPGNLAAPTPEQAFAHRMTDQPEEPKPQTLAARVVATLNRCGHHAFGWSAAEARDLPPPEWLVPGAILAEGFTLLYGPQKKGKSYAALDLALSVVHGRKWLNAWHVLRTGTVLYLALEGHAETTKRAEAWCRHHGVEPSERLLIIGGLRFTDESINEALRLAIEGIEDLSLVVVDTVARAMVGLDENIARDQSIIADRFDRLSRDAGCPVLAVHHSGKAVERGARGSNALPAAATGTMFATIREDGNLLVKVEEIRRGRPNGVIVARPLAVDAEYVVWQGREPLPADDRGLAVQGRDRHAVTAMAAALCTAVEAETITRAAFVQRAEAHAPQPVRGRDFRLDVERLLDTHPLFRAQLTEEGRVALLRAEDREEIMTQLEEVPHG